MCQGLHMSVARQTKPNKDRPINHCDEAVDFQEQWCTKKELKKKKTISSV